MSGLIPQERIDDIRTRYRVSDVARRLTKLQRAGNEWKGLCPVHQEKSPSFYVNDVKGFAHCFGCGFHQDIIGLCMAGFRLSFTQAVEMIDGAGLPPVDPTQLAKAKEEDERDSRAAIADALRFWDDGREVHGTPADRYLCWRKIYTRPPELRFNRIPTWKNPETGRWNRPRPALLLRAENRFGEFVGIQRIYLTEDGGKAPMDNPKLTLGRIRAAGGAVRLGRPRRDVGATGSSEDALTLFQRYGEQATIYLSCGESNLPFLRFPSLVKRVTNFGQNDNPGRAAVQKAMGAQTEAGIEALSLFPKPQFKDWNDEERGICMAAAA